MSETGVFTKARIVSIRDNPDLLESGIDYFSKKWNIDRKIYDDCIKNSMTTCFCLPRWFLLMYKSEIIGSYGLISNDFISRQDLLPWLCALYVDEEFRGHKLGAKMLEHGRRQAALAGFSRIYLATDHIAYYEKYGWLYIADGFHPWGDVSRIYAADSLE